MTSTMRKQQSHDPGRRIPRRGERHAEAPRQGQLWGIHGVERGGTASFRVSKSSQKKHPEAQAPYLHVGHGKELEFHPKLMGSHWWVFRQEKDTPCFVFERQHTSCCE